MQVSNILSLLKTRQGRFSFLAFGFDSFAELSTRHYPEILVEKNQFTLFENSCASWPLARQTAPLTYSDLTDIIKRLSRAKSIILSVSSELAFNRKVIFPHSAIERIDELCELELQRVTPFNPEQVYQGWISTGEDQTNIFVEQFILKKSVVEPAIQSLAASGIAVAGVIIREPNGDAIKVAFAPNGQKFGQVKFETWKKRLALSFGICVLGLGAMLTGINSYFDRQTADVSNAVTDFQPAIQKVKQEIQKFQSLQSGLASVQARRQEISNRMLIIQEVTKILPRNSYLQTLGMIDNHIEMEGLSETPEKLIPLLEASPLFHNTVFASAVFSTPGEAMSHFAVKMDLEQQK